MASSDEKSLAVGHISGFQIDPNWFGIDLHQCCNLYHRNFTSAGYSASSVEKYHYLSDCHRRNRGNLLLIPGVLAVLQCRSLGVPDKVAKIIRIKVLVNDLFSCQNTSERADLFVVRN